MIDASSREEFLAQYAHDRTWVNRVVLLDHVSARMAVCIGENNEAVRWELRERLCEKRAAISEPCRKNERAGAAMDKLPRYRCHKEVEAVKIRGTYQANGCATIYVVPDAGMPTIAVSHDYIRKHNPQPGGYYVRYADGYESYSPAEAFESGYTLLGAEPCHPEPLCGLTDRTEEWERVKDEAAAISRVADAILHGAPCHPEPHVTSICGRLYGPPATVCKLPKGHLGSCVTETTHFPTRPGCVR